MFDAAKYAIIALLAIALASMTGLYLNKRDEMAALEGSVQAIGAAAEKAVKEKEAEGKANLTKIKEDHEAKVPQIRAGAVAAYRAAHRVRNVDPRGGEVPNPGAGQPVDDAGTCEPILDEAFVESAAEDAAKLSAWQDYARLNGIPVTE